MEITTTSVKKGSFHVYSVFVERLNHLVLRSLISFQPLKKRTYVLTDIFSCAFPQRNIVDVSSLNIEDTYGIFVGVFGGVSLKTANDCSAFMFVVLKGTRTVKYARSNWMKFDGCYTQIGNLSSQFEIYFTPQKINFVSLIKRNNIILLLEVIRGQGVCSKFM